MRKPCTRRASFAWLLLVAGGFLGAHRFYLNSPFAGAAQLALLLAGVSGLPASRFCLGLLGLWLLVDIYWVHVRLKRDDGAHARAARRPMAKDYDMAALDEAHKLRERFIAAAAAQDWAQAAALGEQIVAAARRVFKGPHENLAMSLCMHGQACYRLGTFDKAKASLEESLSIALQIDLSAEDLQTIRKALSLVYAETGEYPAAQAIHAALPILSTLSGATVRPEDAPELQALQSLLARQEKQYMEAFAQGDLERAEPLCAEAVATSRRLFAGPDTAVVFHLVNLAEIRRQMKSHDQAIATLHECLTMIDTLDLDDSWRLGPTNTLALVHAATGRHTEAEALYKQTIAMAIAAGKGASTNAVVRAFNNLAFLYADTGQARKAALCYARALVHLDKLDAEGAEKTEQREGSDSDLHASMLNNYADLFMARRDIASAQPLYERALAIQERSCKGISSMAAHAHNALGLIAQERGDLRQALVHFRRTLLLNQICAPDHLGNIANAQRNVDGVSGTLAAVAHAARVERSPT
ncbi:tetratricopeptide repeat protein [Variovorax boronicumulans]|uniref:tetratricopeptide repeat protein n=1 Tax=Variovorax boronicumulans TaxID=436515 RepID=UPI003396D42D